MNTVRGIVEAVREHLEAALPALLEAEGAEDFEAWSTGFPGNQEQRYCCVRLASLKGKESLEFIIHLALPRVSETGAYAYIQGVKNYLDGPFGPADYGFDAAEYELQIFEADFAHGDFQALFSVTLNRSITDCD
jgi:hypothetical protein